MSIVGLIFSAFQIKFSQGGLMQAIARQDTKTVTTMLADSVANVNFEISQRYIVASEKTQGVCSTWMFTWNKRFTPLALAVLKSDREIVGRLIDKGADITVTAPMRMAKEKYLRRETELSAFLDNSCPQHADDTFVYLNVPLVYATKDLSIKKLLQCGKEMNTKHTVVNIGIRKPHS